MRGRRFVSRPFLWSELLEHARFIGNRSLRIIVLTSAFTGMVLALQGYSALVRFGSEAMVGSLVALSLTRELAPVLAALMVAARAGRRSPQRSATYAWASKSTHCDRWPSIRFST